MRCVETLFRWISLDLRCGRQLLDHLKPAGSGVILPTKLWDRHGMAWPALFLGRSLKLFHPDAGIVGTAADFASAPAKDKKYTAYHIYIYNLIYLSIYFYISQSYIVYDVFERAPGFL